MDNSLIHVYVGMAQINYLQGGSWIKNTWLNEI